MDLYSDVGNDPMNRSDPTGTEGVLPGPIPLPIPPTPADIEKSKEIARKIEAELKGAWEGAKNLGNILLDGAKQLVFNEQAPQGAGEPVAEPERERTPSTDPGNFEPVKGSKGKKDTDTGEIWEKDKLHKDHWEVYGNKRDYEKGKRDRDVWDDGRPKRKF